MLFHTACLTNRRQIEELNWLKNQFRRTLIASNRRQTDARQFLNMHIEPTRVDFVPISLIRSKRKPEETIQQEQALKAKAESPERTI